MMGTECGTVANPAWLRLHGYTTARAFTIEETHALVPRMRPNAISLPMTLDNVHRRVNAVVSDAIDLMECLGSHRGNSIFSGVYDSVTWRKRTTNVIARKAERQDVRGGGPRPGWFVSSEYWPSVDIDSEEYCVYANMGYDTQLYWVVPGSHMCFNDEVFASISDASVAPGPRIFPLSENLSSYCCQSEKIALQPGCILICHTGAVRQERPCSSGEGLTCRYSAVLGRPVQQSTNGHEDNADEKSFFPKRRMFPYDTHYELQHQPKPKRFREIGG